MGKFNKKKGDKSRANPIAKPIKPPTDPKLAALREAKILPIINDLQNPDSKKRSAAAIAVANLVEDEQCRKLLLREQIVRILLEQTTTDASLESKSAGWGILRNLALEEEADFSVHLFRQDILTAISGIIKTLTETIQSQDRPIAKLPKGESALVWTIAASITGLVASLAEAQDEVVEAIHKLPAIIDFLFLLLGYEALPDSLFLDVLACLAALTEDSKEISTTIADHKSWFSGLMQLVKDGGPRAVSACGVLHNIFGSMQWFDHNTPVPGASDATLIPTLVNCVSNANTSTSSNSTPDQVLQLALAITASIATSLQEALEHAANNEKEFEGFDETENMEDSAMAEDEDSEYGMDEGLDGALDEDNDVDNEDEDDDDDEITSEMEADMERVTGVDDPDEEVTEEQATISALIRSATPAILPLVMSSDEDTRDNAFSALNNISWTLSSIEFNASNFALYKSWAALAQEIWNKAVSPVLASNTADIALASSVTSLAWALARGVQGQITLQPEEQRKFMALYQASKSLPTPPSPQSRVGKATDAFQGLGVKCIGVLGRLALTPAPIELNREIGVFLLTALNTIPEMPVADVVEALNQLFDIYADKEYACDVTFVADGFLKHLEKILPKTRTAAKSVDKRKDTELRARADEAVLNLDRFIQYKKTERRR